MNAKNIIRNKLPILYKLYNCYRRMSFPYLCRISPRKAVDRMMGEMDWDNPRTINEKLQCLKLGEYYNNLLITTCCDKVLVKEWVKKLGIPCKTAQTYSVYNNPDQIQWNKLPDQFVIKCNHGSGYNIIVSDKSTLDIDAAKKTLSKWLQEDYWTKYCEPQYKFITKRILIEEYLGRSVHTYKFYCFNGQPKVMYISSNGEHGEYDKYYDFFDMNFHWQDIRLKGHLNLKDKVQKPEQWDELVRTAKAFSKDFKFVRVDLYLIHGEIYLSELTFLPTGGYMHFDPPKVLEEWGGWLTL